MEALRSKTGYIGIDRFRMVAALLVVAIHTSPLLSFGEFPDYLLTRVLARLVVPFFFAATGFFLTWNKGGVGRFVKKTALVYAFAILLYLPVNLYAGHFVSVHPVSTVLRLVLVDGTMYHLWYLPAAILGVLVVWELLHFTGLKAATILAALLYAIGLFGDVYYGLVAPVPAIKAMYDGIFAVSAYTRNGLFMAPIFLLAGVWAARGGPVDRNTALAAWLLSLGALVLEGVLLYGAPGKHHDSMYILLPLCVLCLMRWLSVFSGPGGRGLRFVSLVIYIVHPMVIIAVRGAAKRTGLTPIFVDNGLIHYILVCAASVAVAVPLWLKGGMRHAGKGKPPRLGRNRPEYPEA